MAQLGILCSKSMIDLGLKLFTHGTCLAPQSDNLLQIFAINIFSMLLIRGFILGIFLLESTNKLDFERNQKGLFG